jgi:hypothetical protein
VNWDIQNVEDSGVDLECSLTLDSENDPHISYRKNLGGTLELKHAFRSGNLVAFGIETVRSTTEVMRMGRWNDIAYNEINGLRIGYLWDYSVSDPEKDLSTTLVSKKSDGVWNGDNICGSAFLDFGSRYHYDSNEWEEPIHGEKYRLKSDNQGNLHQSAIWSRYSDAKNKLREVNRILYQIQVDRGLDQYCNGVWKSIWVDSYASGVTTVAMEDFHQDLAVDGNDNAHIAFYDVTGDQLKYTTCDSDGITPGTEIVDNTNGAGRGVAIAVDSIGKSYLAYLDDSGSVRYARKGDCGGPALAIGPMRWFFSLGWRLDEEHYIDRETKSHKYFSFGNVGTDSLNVTGLELSGTGLSFGDFCENTTGTCILPLDISMNTPQALQPGEIYTFDIIYEPDAEGKTEGSIIVRSDAGAVSAALQGSGTVPESEGDKTMGCCSLSSPNNLNAPIQVGFLFVLGLLLWRRKRLG